MYSYYNGIRFISRKHKTLVEKVAKYLNKYFTREDSVFKNMQRCSASLILKKIKTTKTYYYVCIKMTILKNIY